jgi:putative phosphoribosyl transferase
MRNNQLLNGSKTLCNTISKSKAEFCKPIVIATSKEAIPLAESINKFVGSKDDVASLFSKNILSSKNLECTLAISNILCEVELYEPLIKAFGIKKSYISKMVTKNRVDLLNEAKSINRDIGDLSFENRDVVLVDLALSTGSSMYLSIKTVKKLKAKRVFVAIILASTAIHRDIKRRVDGLFCCDKIEHFIDKEFYKLESK